MLYLEDFDLAAGGAHVFSVFSVLTGCEGVYLNAERDALLSSVFSRSELSANAVYLDIKKQKMYHCVTQFRKLVYREVRERENMYLNEHRGIFVRIPEKLYGVKL